MKVNEVRTRGGSPNPDPCVRSHFTKIKGKGYGYREALKRKRPKGEGGPKKM